MGLGFCKDNVKSDRFRGSTATSIRIEESKKLRSLMNRNSPSAHIHETGFYLPDNFDDFFYIKEHGLLVFLTGDWFRYEFNRKRPISNINSDRRNFSSSQILPYYNSLRNQSSLDIRHTILDPDDEDYSRASILAEVTLEARREACLVIYNLKRKKIVGKFSKFSFGFSFYSRIRYSQMLKGFLILEVNLSLYLLSICGHRMTKINFAFDKDIDLRCFEVIDSVGLIAVGTKSGNVKLFAPGEEEDTPMSPKSTRLMFLSMRLVQVLPVPLADTTQISSINYCEMNRLLVVNERGGAFHSYKWVAKGEGEGCFKPVVMQHYDSIGILIPFLLEPGSKHYSCDSSIRNRDLWIFEDKNRLYIWKTDIHPPEVFIWETSRLAERSQLRLAGRIDWERLYKLELKKGLTYIEEKVTNLKLLNRDEVKPLILLAMLVLRFQDELEVFDFLNRKSNGYDIISLSVRNGKHYCRLSLL